MRAVGIAAVSVAVLGVAVAVASKHSATGADMQRAARAAIEATGGKWASLSRPGANGTWGITVTRNDDTQVEVTLNERLEVIALSSAPAGRSAHRIGPAGLIAPRMAQAAADPGASSTPAQGSELDDRESPVPASDAERASQVALDAVGGGTVNDVDRENERGATWEVEITKPDGSRVDVLLDAGYRVLDVGGEQDADHSTGDSEDGDSGSDD